MNFSHYLTGYAKPAPPVKPLRVWVQPHKPGPSECYEVGTRDVEAAIKECRQLGRRVLVEIT